MRRLSPLLFLSLALGSCVGSAPPWIAIVALGLVIAFWGRGARAESGVSSEGRRDASVADAGDAADVEVVDAADASGRDAEITPCLSTLPPEDNVCLCAAIPDDPDDPVDLPVIIGTGLLIAGRPRRKSEARAAMTERVLDRAALPPELAERIRDERD